MEQREQSATTGRGAETKWMIEAAALKRMLYAVRIEAKRDGGAWKAPVELKLDGAAGRLTAEAENETVHCRDGAAVVRRSAGKSGQAPEKEERAKLTIDTEKLLEVLEQAAGPAVTLEIEGAGDGDAGRVKLVDAAAVLTVFEGGTDVPPRPLEPEHARRWIGIRDPERGPDAVEARAPTGAFSRALKAAAAAGYGRGPNAPAGRAGVFHGNAAVRIRKGGHGAETAGTDGLVLAAASVGDPGDGGAVTGLFSKELVDAYVRRVEADAVYSRGPGQTAETTTVVIDPGNGVQSISVDGAQYTQRTKEFQGPDLWKTAQAGGGGARIRAYRRDLGSALKTAHAVMRHRPPMDGVGGLASLVWSGNRIDVPDGTPGREGALLCCAPLGLTHGTEEESAGGPTTAVIHMDAVGAAAEWLATVYEGEIEIEVAAEKTGVTPRVVLSGGGAVFCMVRERP